MAKKPTRFIAIDNYEGAVIEIGTYIEVKEAIEEYANDRDMDGGEVEAAIQVFVLGVEQKIQTGTKGVAVDF